MKPLFALGLVIMTAGFGLAGCTSTPELRAKLQGGAAPLPPADQQRLERGEARIGDTPEMVYIALGKPDEKQDVAKGGAVWLYQDYYRKMGHRERTGWSEVVAPGVKDENAVVVQPPVTRDVYREQTGEDIRVTFTAGTVSAIEHLKH